MGFVGFLRFALKFYIDFLAWPLFALGCPLYASIRAIESNSNSDMRNLVAYWILFSLISLFELAFVKLIEWLPFWPYIKLITIFWLVLPHFDGACYVYEHLVRPCLSLNLQVVINQFIKPKKDLPLNEESFLAVAERYVKENGSEALEKLIAGKSKHTEPNIEVEEIEAVASTEENETAAAIHSKFKEPNVAKEDAKPVEQAEKNPSAATKWSEFKEPNVAEENAKAGELKEENVAAATEWSKFKEPNVTKEDAKPVEQAEKYPSAATKWSEFKEPNVAKENAKAGELKEKNVASATEWVKREEPNLAQTEKKTDAAEVKHAEPNPAQTEKNTDAAEVKRAEPNLAQTEKNTDAAEVKHAEPNLAQTEKNTVAAEEIKEKTVVEENKVSKIPASEKVQKEWACAVCQVKTTCEVNLNSHLQGKKHKAKCQALEASKQAHKNKGCSSSTANQELKKSTSGDRPNQNKPKKQEDSEANRSEFWCGLCNVNCLSEIDVASHLNGKKHLSRIQEMIDSLGKGH